MAKFILLSALIFLSSCVSCNKEDEDFTPYPGGKRAEKTVPKA